MGKATKSTNIGALIFVGIVWVVITAAGIFRARSLGWPTCLTDEGVLAMLPLSLGILAIAVLRRQELVGSQTVKCPNCGGDILAGQLHAWQAFVAICFFPLGLLSLLFGRARIECPNCSQQQRNTNATHIESTDPPAMPRSGLGLVSVALILPIISGVMLCFVTSFPVALGISAVMVFTTAALVAIDASRLGKVDLKGRERQSAGLLFVGMLALWIVVYPVAFFRRSAFIAPNLGLVALLVALFSVAAPFVGSMLIPVRLPSCSSTEVVQLLEQVIRSTPVGAATKSIAGHRELSYDRVANVRHGECIAHMDSGDIPVKYIVEWQDQKRGLFQVRLPEPELPACTSREVVQLLEQVIRSTPVGAATKSIDGHRELSYDGTTNVRHGECVAHADSGDISVKFIVEWKDRKKGMFQVQILASPD